MKTLAVLTTTRAEYGLLKPIIKAIDAEGIGIKLLVTGMHLSGSFGKTINEIKNDGIEIATKIPILVDSDTPAAVSKTMALAMLGFADFFSENKPDALLVLGDRYETLAVCCAAINERIPIFHLYGGETTEGAIDEAMRHAITKMSYLHLTSTEAYRNRVIQLGESPNRVFNVGAIGVENALSMQLMDKSTLEKALGVVLGNIYAVMTHHPVTLDNNEDLKYLKEILSVVENHPEITFLATKSNADAGGRAINMALSEFAENNQNLYVFDSLGSLRYLSAISGAAFVLGNSSSGILEAPAFFTPTVNIGSRQRGRIKPDSVIDCEDDSDSIELAIAKATDPSFRKKISSMINPYGQGDTSSKVARLISQSLRENIDLKKKFYDVEWHAEGAKQ